MRLRQLADLAGRWCRESARQGIAGWNRFWFTPADPTTLCVIRVFAGAMLLYTHAAWSVDLQGFFAPGGRIPESFVREFQGSSYAWSHLYGIESATLLWGVHGLALAILLAFTLGLATRWTGWLAYLITVGYAHRAAGALFGLDQINGLLALYLAIGPSGQRFSVDAWRRGQRFRPERRPDGAGGRSTMANVAIRLIQIHMCVIYLFAGLGKLLGPTWWAGTALWGAFANYEYQTLDMTWLAAYPLVVNVLTQVTVVWEISYAALIWSRWTRPWMLALAIPIHLGIALCMGMTTFGLAMLIGNLAFVPPWLLQMLLGREQPPPSVTGS